MRKENLENLFMYKPLPKGITIRESPIDGFGLFATKKILAGTFIGIVHVKSKKISAA